MAGTTQPFVRDAAAADDDADDDDDDDDDDDSSGGGGGGGDVWFSLTPPSSQSDQHFELRSPGMSGRMK